MDRNREYLEVFAASSLDQLSGVETALLAAEQEGCRIDPEPLRSMFRALHSVKGDSASLGLHDIRLMAHDFESILQGLIDGRPLDSSLIDELLSRLDSIRSAIALACR